MKALVLNTAEHSASVQEVPSPTPKGKEILVKVHSVALNPVDAIYVAHPIAQQANRIVGTDFAGEVVGVSDEITESDDPRVKLRARVSGLLQGACSANERPGAFAEYLTVDWDLVYLVPPHMPYVEAATIPLCSLTAAQGAFYRLGLPCPFWQPSSTDATASKAPAVGEGPIVVFIYGGSTSLGMYAAQQVQLARTTTSSRPIKLIGAASAKNHALLQSAPYSYDELVDYRDADWPAKVRSLADGKGVDYAIDCISEWPLTGQVNSALNEHGRQAVFRSPKSAGYLEQWNKMERKPQYGAAWEGLGHEIHYSGGMTIPASPEARAFAAKFFAYLTEGALKDKALIKPNPIRLMPGGLGRIAQDGLVVQSSGMLSAPTARTRTEDYMRPISCEKLVYNIT